MDDFIDRFNQLMELHVENTGPDPMARGIARAAFPRDGAGSERIEELTTE